MKQLTHKAIHCLTVFVFAFQPMAHANPSNQLFNESMKTYFKETGLRSHGMTYGEFAKIASTELLSDGAHLINEMYKPFWNKKMPRMEFSAAPQLRINFFHQGRTYTLEIINSEKTFARLNGHIITWEQLVTAEKLLPHIFEITSGKDASAQSIGLLNLLFPVAKADEDINDSGEGIQEAPVNFAPGTTTQSSAQPNIGAQMGKGLGWGHAAIGAAIVGIALIAAKGSRRSSSPETRVIVVPPRETPKKDEDSTPKSRFAIADDQLKDLDQNKIVSGIRTYTSDPQPRGYSAPRTGEMEAIF